MIIRTHIFSFYFGITIEKGKNLIVTGDDDDDTMFEKTFVEIGKKRKRYNKSHTNKYSSRAQVWENHIFIICDETQNISHSCS